MPLVPHQALSAFLVALLQAHGAPPSHAATVADALVLADLRGLESHGSARMPSYLARIRAGALDPAAEPEYTPVTACVGRVDGRNGFGFVAAARAIDECVDLALGPAGLGLVSVRGSNHFGMAGWVARRAVERGRVLALIFTNSSPALPPHGARGRLLGAAPLACGAPGGGGPDSAGDDFILDMSPAVAARGKIHTALRRGEPIPPGWALDADGNPTTDPAAALAEGSTLLPAGGPKGAALAILMDVLAGVLTGSAFGGDVAGPYGDTSRPADVGHLMIAVRPDLFLGSAAEFRARMDELYRRVVGASPLPGVDRVYFPGELEAICERERRRTGIPLTDHEIGLLNDEAGRAGCATLHVSQQV